MCPVQAQVNEQKSSTFDFISLQIANRKNEIHNPEFQL